MPAPVDVAALDQAREVLLGRGLAALAAWAMLNLVGSGYHLRRADRRFEPYYFHGMNVGWGLVNAALAFWGIWQLRATPAGFGVAGLVHEQLAAENLFLLNAGLDVAYVMTGFYLRALAAGPKPARPERLLGFGQALWVQGGFLLAFDALMWSLLHAQGRGWLGQLL